jgi:hypothetical protein
MPNRYANFYRALPPTTQQSVTSIYEILAPEGNRGLEWLVVALARPTEFHVMAYLGLDDRIHVIHCASIVQPSLLYPNTRHEGNAIGLVDELTDFGSNLAVFDGEFFKVITAADVPSADAITAALAADTDGDQLLIPADDRATNVTTRFGALVPVPYVPELLGMLAQGPVSPGDLWEVAA